MLIDGGNIVRCCASATGSLVYSGSVVATVLLGNRGTVRIRPVTIIPPPSPRGLVDGRVVAAAVLLFNVCRTVIGTASVDALLDGGLVTVATLLENGFGIVVPAALRDSGSVVAATGLVDI